MTVSTPYTPFRGYYLLGREGSPLLTVCQTVSNSLETSAATVDNECQDITKQVHALESNQYFMECQLEVLKARQQVLDKEVNLYVAQESADDKSDSILHQVQSQLNDQQTEKERLKQQQMDFRKNETQHRKQLKMWTDLKTLLAIKQRCLTRDRERNAINEYAINSRPDHLVL
ncbi:unnamed protein product [Oppiella nova]|uniref:Uncharacterized protein n=1 Tax=Oppiella nova TaxID=334625 RepID=A0A7R9LZD5_9ACAR|nr:unnamed protein product [Oppiella nova]CAG2167805.1 unnamed protein product [Oppiella nova]